LQTSRSLALPMFAFLLVGAIVPAFAEIRSFNEMPNETPNEILGGPRTECSSASVYNATATTSVSLPDTPAPQRVRVIDKKFIAVMGALAVSESLRFTTHKLVLDHEYDAGAPWVTNVPPNSHLVAKYAGIYAAELLVAYELKKPHSWLTGDKVIRKLWWVYPAAAVPFHLKNGVRSIRTQAPSGCPVAECQAP
jgi:hypothetical protein